MVLITSSHNKDLLSVKLTDNKLSFMLKIVGEHIRNVKKYKVCCNEKSIPSFLILHEEGKLYYYYFQDNKWKKRFLCPCKESANFYLTLDNSDYSYILVENEEKDSFLYYCKKDDGWTKALIDKNKNFKLLKWFVKENKIYLLGTDNNKSLTFWQASTFNPEKWLLIYDYPLADNELLNVWFTPSTGTEFLTLEFSNMNFKLIYNNLTENGEVLSKQTVTQLDHLKINKPILLRDTRNKGIVYTVNNRLLLYKYRGKEKKWVGLKTETIFPVEVKEIVTSTGIANSHLALTKILNLELEVPVAISLDHLAQAMELKRAQSLGFHVIRKLGSKL